jgi:RNA-binding protein Musashi
MDSDEGKLFIGGISWETTEEKLKEHFGQYGGVSQAVIMRDKATGRPRGFGFVVFSDPSILDRVLQDRHTIDGRTVSIFNFLRFAPWLLKSREEGACSLVLHG